MQKAPRPRRKEDILQALEILEKHNWIIHNTKEKKLNYCNYYFLIYSL
ncbi:hypothetical protein CAXC1_220060 [Candidatus Xenohaliotis californiensis]|uniref:Uncharacterized protein n=1 Tax=Candidatus Xenohaliotis californiensis TaxID=84677 RepID=A0ABP0ESG0_9RICK|nr:hypothetical protein CAXC1_220060 [Candidatus Xenohaliotis californiensis]